VTPIRLIYRPERTAPKALSLAPTEAPRFLRGFQVIRDLLSQWWCHKMHKAPMWPMHGKYTCPTCFREYKLDWNVPRKAVHGGD
jgi:hypothetical protein